MNVFISISPWLHLCRTSMFAWPCLNACGSVFACPDVFLPFPPPSRKSCLHIHVCMSCMFASACLQACVSMFACSCLHGCPRAHVHVCVFACRRPYLSAVHVHPCMSACPDLWMSMSASLHVHACMSACPHGCMSMSAWLRVHVCMAACPCKDAHAGTQTPTWTSWFADNRLFLSQGKPSQRPHAHVHVS